MPLTRRQFGQDTLGALLTYSLLDMLLSRDALGAETKALAAKWEAWAKRARVIPWVWKPPYKPLAK